MVSKEPNHLLTGQTNGKSTLADKMPGTITVRSVLLNRDSPDIESRLKRRRNRTHKVHFKDLEDGSSSSGNSGTGENNNTHQKPATDCDSPHPVRKQNSRSVKPWCDRGGLHTDCSLPGQTSVVGAVRGDMASTIEVVAAFLARAPPHPLTPGPTRRCWMPPQTNSLTLPMTRKPSTSTSTAIQTSPCLRKPHSISSNHNRSHSFGDSVGMDGDDEHDSQDEFFMHNHALLPWSKHLNGPPGNVDKPVVERRSKASRTENKSTVAVIKNSRHSCPPSVSQITEPCQCSSLCQEGTKRSGSVTPSVVRRRKRLNRTTSDPGKEIHYCTTPTQTERPCSSPPLTNTKVCTTQVQTESVCPPVSSKYCTTQCQTETPQHSPVFGDIKSKPSTQCEALDSVLLPNLEQSVTISENNSSSHSTLEPSLTEGDAPCDVPSLPVSTESNVDLPERTSTQSVSNETPVTEKNTVPYCATSTLTNQPTQTPENDSKSSSSPESQAVCVNPIVSQAPPIALCTSASSVNHPIPYYTVVSPSSNTAAIVACSSPSLDAQPSPTLVETTCTKSIISTSPAVCPATASTATPNEVPLDAIAAPNSADIPQQNATISTSATKQTPCTFVTQTAMSCTSISYYTTTHASGPQGLTNNTTKPSYAALIQTVSHCNIPCRALQNTSVASTGITPYSSPVPRLKSCTSPTPLVKTGTSTLPSRCITPTKAVPLYSSTFRAAPPYTPPSQVPYSAQDKRGMRLPPPPPPPPPYTPRKKETDPPGPAIQTPKLRAESNPVKKEEDNKKENGEHLKCTDSPKRCERANSLKHRAQTPPVSGMKVEKQPSSSSPLKACFKSSCLSSAQAQLGMLHKMLCSGATSRPTTPNSQHALPSNQQGCSGTKGCGGRPTAGPLTAAQADTLKQVQEILGGLMSGARCKLDPARVAERLLSPNGPLRDIRSLQTQLQSLEGVLETSQNTIKVLLDVIQDLEKKEAERDGHSYRTGQDIENCGTCRDCACIIYSVEHDFRLQEGQVVRTWKVGDPPEAMPPQTSTPVHSAPQQQDSPQSRLERTDRRN